MSIETFFDVEEQTILKHYLQQNLDRKSLIERLEEIVKISALEEKNILSRLILKLKPLTTSQYKNLILEDALNEE